MHQAITLKSAKMAYCSTCNAVLARRHSADVSQVLAITIAAAILFVIASATPVLSIELGAIHTQANVWIAALSMANGWMCAAVALALATFLVPMMQLACCYGCSHLPAQGAVHRDFDLRWSCSTGFAHGA